MAILNKAKQVEKALRSEISSGRWDIGEMIPTEAELLDEFGVSRTTLRHALSVLVGDGIVVRKPGSGTFISRIVKPYMVAIFAQSKQMTSSMGYWHRRIIDEMRYMVRGSDYRPVLAIGYGATIEECAETSLIAEKSFLQETAGVILHGNVQPAESRLWALNIPSITIEVAVPLARYNVVLDYQEKVRRVKELMTSHGHDDFAVMYCEYSRRCASNAAVHDELDRLHKNIVDGDMSRLIAIPDVQDNANAYDAFKEWWAKPNRPNSIYFFDDAICDMALRAVLELGIRVPEDLSIATHANLGRRFGFPAEVTSIGFDPVEVVNSAWTILDRLIAGQEVKEPTVRAKPHLRQGGTVRSRS